jgi:hypothetical protein
MAGITVSVLFGAMRIAAPRVLLTDPHREAIAIAKPGTVHKTQVFIKNGKQPCPRLENLAEQVLGFAESLSGLFAVRISRSRFLDPLFQKLKFGQQLFIRFCIELHGDLLVVKEAD